MMVDHLKRWLEGLGLAASLTGLAAILQPFSLSVYTYGFYILAIGATIFFVGSTIPERTENRALTQSIVLIIFVTVLLLLTVYFAPLMAA